MIRLEMKNYNMILKRSSKNISILTGEEILPPDQRRVIEEAKFAYSDIGKAFEKQIKTIEDQWEKKQRHLQSMGNN